ncbi:MAG: methylenetetrahydrofolate reductase [Pseudomonadota bacterium]|nr:methylenetetrahydrofolate reductase [Pseudomonadota bacterium]
MTQERRAASEFQARLRSGDFVVTAEITPPVSTDPAEFLRRAMPLKGLATAVNVTDGAGAKVHLSSLATAHFLVQSGIEPIFQMTCRDRNRLALQSDLLGAAALGIRNILALAGDDPKGGDQPEAKPVYDLDSKGLLAMANRMRAEGVLPSGTKIDGPLRLVLGAADVPIDPKPGWEPKGLKAKIEAGADFVQTQFCMDILVVRRYMSRLREAGIQIPILVGVAPIPSARSARWMREKLFGTIIPDEHVARLEKAADAKLEGRKICVEVLQQFAEIPGVAGAHVMAPMNFAEIPIVIAESKVAGKRLHVH